MRMDVYPCLTKQLITSYREQFDSPNMNFVAVQLPGTFSFIIVSLSKQN